MPTLDRNVLHLVLSLHVQTVSPLIENTNRGCVLVYIVSFIDRCPHLSGGLEDMYALNCVFGKYRGGLGLGVVMGVWVWGMIYKGICPLLEFPGRCPVFCKSPSKPLLCVG